MSIISESEDIATMTINHYERILRERDEAREKIWGLEKQIEGLNNAANERFEEIERVINERDEARKEVEFLKKTPLRQRCQELERLSDHWCDMHTVAAKERDEARELLESEKNTRNHIIRRGIEIIEKRQQERDEAREENARLRNIIEIAISIGNGFFDDLGIIVEDLNEFPDWGFICEEFYKLKEETK